MNASDQSELPTRIEALNAIRNEDVTWTSRADGRTSYRFWYGEKPDEYELVTKDIAPLVREGLATCWTGVGLYGKGMVELTLKGKAELRAWHESGDAS